MLNFVKFTDLKERDLTISYEIERLYGNLPFAIPRLQPQTELSNFPLYTCSHIPFSDSTY